MIETHTLRDHLRGSIPGLLSRGNWRALGLIYEKGSKGLTDRDGAEALDYSLKYYRRTRRELARLRLIGTVRGDPPGAPRRWSIADADFVLSNLGRFKNR